MLKKSLLLEEFGRLRKNVQDNSIEHHSCEKIINDNVKYILPELELSRSWYNIIVEPFTKCETRFQVKRDRW